MKRMSTAALPLMATFVLLGLAGCTTEADVARQAPPAAETAPSDLPPEVVAELAGLSDSDRVLAMEQRICPVTGKLLGSMGQPPKLSVEGREVFICCAGCEDRLRSDPEQYFAKIDNR